MKYFLKEPTRYAVKIDSSIDGKPVSLEGTMAQITIARQKKLQELLDKYDLNEANAKINKELVEAIVEAKEYPELAFYESEDFEFFYVAELVRFFLTGLTSL